MSKLASSVLVAVLLCLFCESAPAQSRISDSHSRTETNDPDNVIKRQEWFRRGRQGTNGKSAAALRYEAYQQMVARRKAARAESKQSATHTTGGSFTTSQTWSLLGPSPIVSNLSGSPTADYDYGPAVGRVTALFVDPTDATGNTVYLGGATGGLWRSTNAAATTASSVTWSPLLDGQPTLSVGAIGVQPGNSNLIILGTGEPDFSIDSYYALGLLRSTDRGATWTLINSAVSGLNGAPVDLKGVAFSGVVFSADNPNVVVVAAGASGVGFGDRIETATDGRFGIFYSTDAGQTWTSAVFQDGTIPVAPWSVSSIVYNPIEHLFYATVGFQGIYSSADGATWTRLASQPGAGLTLSNCPAYFATTCPIFRGALAIRPGADEMYAWYVDLNSNDQGIYKTSNGGQTWAALSETGIKNCGDAEGCSTEQGFFNLVLSAVPQPNGATDLYAGAVNLFKCSITAANPTCSTNPFRNLTHVYGCSPIGSMAHVHPDQHAIEFAPGNPQIVYFGNDGGIYRALNAASLTSGACGTPNSFDNLSGTMGSMAQFVWLSQDPTNEQILLGGTQDNGSPARTTAIPAWPEVNLGDGGYNAINPAAPNEWFTAHTDISIARCTVGSSCAPATFTPVVTNATLSGDVGSFYTPYILDPQAPSKMIVGTCRVWRGPSNSGTGWTALSNNFDTASATTCAANSPNAMQAIAAAGPVTANGSQVIWTGTSGGVLWYTTNADGGPSAWSYVSTTYSTPISSIAIDPKDPTGKTVYFTTQGFYGNQITLISPITTTGVAGDLPNIPVNSIVFDPEFQNIMYVGTDIGVFQTVNGGANWVEVGPGTLPSAPVSHLEVFHVAGVKKLRASTYGRGVWETSMPTGSIPMVSFSNYTVKFSAQPIGTTSSATTLTLTNIGSAALNVTTLSLAGSEFLQTNNCPAALAAAASCTINITFTPTSSGNHLGTLSLTDDAYDSPQDVQLVGNIPVPALKIVFSAGEDFGADAIGVVSNPQVVILANSGTGPLTITNISVTGDFSETDNCVGVLAINQNCQVNVTFRPTAAGSRTGSLLITDDAAGSPQSTPLSGLGIAQVAMSTATINFPSVLVGQSSAPVAVTVSNFTSSTIGVNKIVVTPPNDFSQTNTCGTSVPSQASCVITVTFTPAAGDSIRGDLLVVDGNGNSMDAAMIGGGTDFALSSSTFATTASVTAGQTATYTVWLGPQAGFVGTVSLSCRGGPKGSTCTTTPASATLNSLGGGYAITVSVKTSAAGTAVVRQFPRMPYGIYFVLRLSICLLLALATLLWWRRRTAENLATPRAAVIALLIGVLFLAGSCGGGSSAGGSGSSATPQSYIITVSGTSGSLTNSAQVMLTVNP
jgi:Abnormal spindle-like microcephaly-assoc'd, ASPM-SPD-2-Hydin